MDEQAIVCVYCGTLYYEEDGNHICPCCGTKNQN